MSDAPTPISGSVVQVPPADTPGVQGLLTLAVAVVIVAGLYLGREVMVPIILAVLLSFLLAPVANFLRRLHLGRVPSALLAVVLALGIILMIGAVIGTQLAELAQEVPRYASSVERKVETLQSHTLGRITTVIRSLGHELDRASAPKNPGSGVATAELVSWRRTKVDPGRSARAAAEFRATCPTDHLAYRRTAGDHGDRLHRCDLHLAAARGSARSVDQVVRF